MAKYQLLLPKMGESVAEATIIKWNKNPGDYIEADDAVMEIATDKVDSEVPSPVSGKLVEQLCKEDDVVQVGAVIAIIETDVTETTSAAPQSAPAPAITSQPQAAPQPPPVQQAAPAQPAPEQTQAIPGIDQLPNRPPVQYNEAAFKNASRFYSPLVKHIATQEGIGIAELDQIPGSGMEGRLTKDDLLNYVKTRQAKPAAAVPQQQYAAASAQQPVAEQPVATGEVQET